MIGEKGISLREEFVPDDHWVSVKRDRVLADRVRCALARLLRVFVVKIQEGS
jgi:hypothetical protein